MPSISPSQMQRQVEYRTAGRVPAPLATNSLQGNQIKVIKEPGPELVLCLQGWSHISAQLSSWGRLLPSLGPETGQDLRGACHTHGEGLYKEWGDRTRGMAPHRQRAGLDGTPGRNSSLGGWRGPGTGAQRCCGCPICESVPGWAGWGLEQVVTVEGVPAQGRRLTWNNL